MPEQTERYGYAGANWITKALKITPSPLGEKVADLLGDAWFGIYHMDYKALKKAAWDHPDYISVTVYGDLATYDFDRLTRLVILCHDRLLRMEIEGIGPRYLRLSFSRRERRDGDQYQKHPTIEQAVQNIRAHYQQGTPVVMGSSTGPAQSEKGE